MLCKCARCGEDLTAPHFFKGKPYGWTCIKIVNPTARKPKVKDIWVKSESVYTILECSNHTKRKVIATYDGRKYVDWHYVDLNGNEVPASCIVITDDACLINLARYKKYMTNA